MKHKPKELWIDTRLKQEEMDFLWDAISSDKENKENHNHALVGNIFKSEIIKDTGNWFYESALKKLTKKMFYRDWDNFSKYHIEEERPFLEFKMDKFWVNYQKQHEFNPLPHMHAGLFSFVVFMKIPIHWKEQHALPFVAHSNAPSASDFQFVWTEKDSVVVQTTNFSLSSEDEGRMLFFPASLQHQVYPFYGTEEKRITISGNIVMKDLNEPKIQEIPTSEYEKRKDALKIMENTMKLMKEELEWVKKAGENEGSN